MWKRQLRTNLSINIEKKLKLQIIIYVYTYSRITNIGYTIYIFHEYMF